MPLREVATAAHRTSRALGIDVALFAAILGATLARCPVVFAILAGLLAAMIIDASSGHLPIITLLSLPIIGHTLLDPIVIVWAALGVASMVGLAFTNAARPKPADILYAVVFLGFLGPYASHLTLTLWSIATLAGITLCAACLLPLARRHLAATPLYCLILTGVGFVVSATTLL